MKNSNINYTVISSDVKKSLIDDWLPKLNDINNSRKPVRNIMIAIIIIPFILCTICAILGAIDLSVYLTIAGTSLAISFVYIGKLQSCSDRIVEIDMIVRLGYVEPLLNTIENLGCYSKFENLIKEMGGIFKYGK